MKTSKMAQIRIFGVTRKNVRSFPFAIDTEEIELLLKMV